MYNFETKTWTLGGHTYESPSDVNTFCIAKYRELLFMALGESRLGKTLPNPRAMEYERAVEDAVVRFMNLYGDAHAQIICEAFLVPAEGSPPVEVAYRESTRDEKLGVITFFMNGVTSTKNAVTPLAPSGHPTTATDRVSSSKNSSRPNTGSGQKSQRQRDRVIPSKST